MNSMQRAAWEGGLTEGDRVSLVGQLVHALEGVLASPLSAQAQARAHAALAGARNGRWPPPAGMTWLHVRTRHPEHYVLLNEQDGSRWRATAQGQWVRGEKAPA